MLPLQSYYQIWISLWRTHRAYQSIYTRSVESQSLGSEIPVVRTTLRYELARVAIVLVPSFLRRVERTSIGIALGFEIVDGIDSRATSTNTDHRSVLIGTDDGSKRI